MKKIKQNNMSQRLGRLFFLAFILFFFFINFGCMDPNEYKPDEPPEKLEPPEAPTVLLPESDAVFRSKNQCLVHFDWSHVEGNQGYEYEIDTTPDFIYDYPHTTSPPIAVLLSFYPPQTTYFFRVRAYSNLWIWYTNWSEPRRFHLLPVSGDTLFPPE